MRFIAIVLLVVSVTFSLNAKDIEVGDVPPSFVGKTLDGKRIQLSEMTGKVIVVTFWATWCGPCLRELPVLNFIQQQVSVDRLQVVAVNYGEGKKHVKYIQQQIPESNIKFALDKRKYSSKKYGVKGIPHMVIVDSAGKVAHIHIGYGDDTKERLAKELNVLLKAIPVVINNAVVEKKI